MLRHFGDIGVSDDDASRVDREYTGNRIQNGRLAGAVTADHRRKVTVLKREAHTLEGLLFIRGPGEECLINVFKFQHQEALPVRRDAALSLD